MKGSQRPAAGRGTGSCRTTRSRTAMPTKTSWTGLAHREKMLLLAQKTVSELVQSYHREAVSEAAFREQLEKEVRLWDPGNIQGVEEIAKVPTKDVVLGAWRDLDRAEAIMELIDNSIDAWNM